MGLGYVGFAHCAMSVEQNEKKQTLENSYFKRKKSVTFYVISLPYPGPGKLFPQSTFCSEAIS